MNIRTQAPPYTSISSIDLIETSEYELNNGLKIFAFTDSNQELIKIDINIKSGQWDQTKPLQAIFTSSMLQEGTANYSSKQIAESFDYLGTYIIVQANKHICSITLYTLARHFEKSLLLVEELLKRPTFLQEELEIMMSKKRQKMIIDNKRIEIQASNEFFKRIFGTNNPYGRVADIADIDNITRNDLLEYYSKHFCANNCEIVIAGNIGNEQIEILNKYFGQNDWYNPNFVKEDPNHTFCKANEKKYFAPQDYMQSALKIGYATINSLHPDFSKLMVVNTILGDYFGSRLMMNIREDKGYTYGVQSSLISLKKKGAFLISTNVKKECKDAAIAEIYKEINRLKNEPISFDELDLVKNYILGNTLRTFDGAFAQSENFINVHEYNLTNKCVYDMINIVTNITPDDIMEIAKKYLNENEMYEVVIG